MKCAMIFAALALAAASDSELQFKTSGVTASIAFNSASVLTVGDTSTCTKIDGDTACILDRISNIEAASCRQMGCATCSADLTQCTSCPQTEQTLTADGRCPVSGWIKLVDNAFYNGNSMPAPFVPLVHGDFTRIKAVRRSGCVGCSHSGSASGARWQCCSDASGHAADAISFELMKADTYIVQQPNWHTLPSQCNSDGVAGDIICDVSFSIDKFETITPTWQEPSNGVSLSDNHGTVYLDLYVWGAIREQSDQYVQILDNVAYFGNRMADPITPLAYGSFSKFVAVYRSGCVGCSHSGSASNKRWQCCSDASGHAADAISFEIMKNNNYLVQSVNWHTLPTECINTGGADGNIICNKPFSLASGDTLTPTWQEPSNGVSLSDNHGTVYLDLWALPI